MSGESQDERLHTDASFQRVVINRTPLGTAKGNSLENKRGWTAQIEWEGLDCHSAFLTTGHGRTITEAIEMAIRK